MNLTTALPWIIIMVAGGTIGGFASYCATNIPEGESHPLLKRVVLGVAGALVVPLFLNMISSSILSASPEPTNYLVFAGFCVAAGFSSKTFLSSISKQMMARLESVEYKQHELEEEVEPILAKETEPTDEATIDSTILDLDENDEKVLTALSNPKYTRRYIKGICSETGLEDVRAIYHLLSLCDKGLVNQRKAKEKDLFWLTSLGWKYVRSKKEGSQGT